MDLTSELNNLIYKLDVSVKSLRKTGSQYAKAYTDYRVALAKELMKEKVLRIINNYGAMNQLKYMQTEMFEFVEAVINYNNLSNEKNKEHIEEEYADLMVMLEQFHAYYNLDDMHISEVMHQKIDRQLKRIEND